MKIDLNAEFRAALSALDAGANVFITGKAGTGKSTLLRHYLAQATGRIAVTAPTGVAALNVGGSTIHRLFGFSPAITPEFAAGGEYRGGRNRKVLQTLETLVIDEASMMRADLLDAVAAALTRFGPAPGEPFGGVQLVLVGDLYQLPPVVQEGEAAHFRSRYTTPYFFSADAFRDLEYTVIELEKVYRQRDNDFITLLNDIRAGTAGAATVAALNARVDPEFRIPRDEFWLTLTTTNNAATQANARALAQLPTPEVVSLARSTGKVTDQDQPTAEKLVFKEGAQVMLLTNDPGERWVNGSIGTVQHVGVKGSDFEVTIRLLDGTSVTVGPHTWDITEPVIEDGVLRHASVGTYTQLPFTLAWAITIHKSQGQTLERVVIDLGRQVFAEGQLYVALSRCTSFDGMVLRRPIRESDIKVEWEITRFLERSQGRAGTAERFAYLGLLVTDLADEYGRAYEIALLIEERGEVIAEVSTLLNPMRDLGRAALVTGITAQDVSDAPTLAEAWGFLARQLDGAVLVGSNLPAQQTVLEREMKRLGHPVEMGVGIDVRELVRGRGRTETQHLEAQLAAATSAVERAAIVRATAGHYDLHAQPVRPFRLSDLDGSMPAALRFRTSPRGGPPAAATAEIAYGDAVAVAIGAMSPGEIHVDLENLAAWYGISAEDVATIHQQALDRAVERAGRDDAWDDTEHERLAWAAARLGLPTPQRPEQPAEVSADDALYPGARVCFTGTAVINGTEIARADLEAQCQDLGLVPVPSVTKTRCDVLVAADPASMSGKAKKAREYGKPVLSVAEFVAWRDAQR